MKGNHVPDGKIFSIEEIRLWSEKWKNHSNVALQVNQQTQELVQELQQANNFLAQTSNALNEVAQKEKSFSDQFSSLNIEFENINKEEHQFEQDFIQLRNTISSIDACLLKQEKLFPSLEMSSIELNTYIQQIYEHINNKLKHCSDIEQNIKVAATGFPDILKTITASKDYQEEIGKMVNAINEISSKINLLAINTAIIAEKGSSKGEGFRAIAKEIQVLAEQTKFSSDEIAKMTTNFSLNTTTALKNIDTGTKSLSNASQNVEYLKEELNLLKELVQKIETFSQKATDSVVEVKSNLEELLHLQKSLFEGFEHTNIKIKNFLAEHDKAAENHQKLANFYLTKNNMIKGLAEIVAKTQKTLEKSFSLSNKAIETLINLDKQKKDLELFLTKIGQA